ncbi:MAG: hypothetical protein GX877_05310 [Bacteroidales bacterium]|nr:hypothetical protein [Bacteroidales bacterium]
MKKILFALLAFALFYSCTPQEVPIFTFTDSRDGKEYKMVKIGTQIWMAENLAFMPYVTNLSEEVTTKKQYFVYDYDGGDLAAAKATENYETYGALYNWHAALTACPDGWHLPTHEEWKQLAGHVKNNVGGRLKAITHWKEPNINANNRSGFSALPGGALSHPLQYRDIGEAGYWWTATADDQENARCLELSYQHNVGLETQTFKADGLSVRCVRN